LRLSQGEGRPVAKGKGINKYGSRAGFMPEAFAKGPTAFPNLPEIHASQCGGDNKKRLIGLVRRAAGTGLGIEPLFELFLPGSI
jgi:hypothetical protein